MSYVQKKPKGARTLIYEGQTYYWQTGSKFTKIYGPDKSRAVLNANIVRVNSEDYAEANRLGDESSGAVTPSRIESYIAMFWSIGDPVSDEEERKDARLPQYQYQRRKEPYSPYDPSTWDDDDWEHHFNA